METIRVLHMEDDRFDQELVRDTLHVESEGFSVTVISTLEALARHLDDPQFDCIVSDLHLLGFDGLEVLELARTRLPDIPFVFMTGTGSEELAVEAMKRGADDYIIKRPSHVIRLPVAIHGALAKHRTLQELRLSEAKTRRALEGAIQAISTALEVRDAYTAGHQRRVAHLAAAIATEMGLTEEQTFGVRLAGTVHDVGKIQVPAEILNKPGPLGEVEFQLIMAHPQVGNEILKGIDFPWPVAEAVLQHHERLGGGGYPAGLKGDQIIVEARIIAVADTVEAMSSHRPYRPALGLEAGLSVIEEGRGTLFDERVVDACLRLFREQGYSMAE